MDRTRNDTNATPDAPRALTTVTAGGTGATVAATAALASACCAGPTVAPAVVAVLGAGGAAWAAGLKPYSPYLLTGSGVLLAWTFWLVYRPRVRCAPAAGHARWHLMRRLTVWSAWGAATIWIAAVFVNLFLGG